MARGIDMESVSYQITLTVYTRLGFQLRLVDDLTCA